MPVTVAKKGRCFEVRTPKGVKAACATAENAAKQKRLLQAVEHGWRPTK